MAPTSKDRPGTFLGGGPKFNQAGNNTPLPGERTAEGKPAPPFGGPRVWVGTLVVLVLIGVLWFVYGNGLMGVGHKGSNHVASPLDRPSDNPDAPSGQ